MSLVEQGYPPRSFHLPARKPLPQQQRGPQIYVEPTSRSQTPATQQEQQQQVSHSRTRTASSSVFPTTEHMAPSQPSAPPSSYPYQQTQLSSNQNPIQYQAHMNQQISPQPGQARRTLSNATTSTTSTNGGPLRQDSDTSSLERSTSSRSGSAPLSYVALMRKQKATVWSDRAQHEDPRLQAQRHAAKLRAAAEVSSLNAIRTGTAGSSSGLGVRSKIRHHGAPKAREYIQTGNRFGVPLRLSQNEMEEGEGESETNSYSRNPSGLGMGGQGHPPHRRTDSGRSSVGSASKLGFNAQGQAQGVSPSSRTPPSRGSPVDRRSQPHSAEETPNPDAFRGQEYFGSASAKSPVLDGRFQEGGGAPVRSGSSGGSTQREEQFGEAGLLPLRIRKPGADGEAPPDEETQKKLEAELRRRGSVDERTMTMSTGLGRLFIANPDS